VDLLGNFGEVLLAEAGIGEIYHHPTFLRASLLNLDFGCHDTVLDCLPDEIEVNRFVDNRNNDDLCYFP